MNNGFIIIWRKFTETSFYKDSYAVALCLHLLLKANHEDRKFTFNGQEQNLKRGQFITGRKVLSIETGIHESTIRLKLDLLQKVGFCTIKSTNKFSIITICKYSDYQDKKEKKNQKNHQPSDSQLPTNYQPSDSQLPQTTIQQYNNDNNVTTKTNKVFTPPLLQDVEIYCKDRNNGIDPQTFIDFYQARGWKFKTGQPVKDWKACIRTWESRNKKPVETLTETQKKNIANFNDWEKRQESLNGSKSI